MRWCCAAQDAGATLAGGFFLTPTLVAHRDTAAFFVQ